MYDNTRSILEKKDQNVKKYHEKFGQKLFFSKDRKTMENSRKKTKSNKKKPTKSFGLHEVEKIN